MGTKEDKFFGMNITSLRDVINSPIHKYIVGLVLVTPDGHTVFYFSVFGPNEHRYKLVLLHITYYISNR